ncbi:MAG: hypothetical protein ACRC68_16255, partial [Clostridium sp.]
IYGTNDIEGKPLYKESVKTEQPGIVAEIILVNGDVTISPREHKNNVYLKNTVIIATGDIILENSFSPGKNGRAVLTDCILYGTKLKANIHGQIMIDNSYWFTAPKGILHYNRVRVRMAEILIEYLIEIK